MCCQMTKRKGFLKHAWLFFLLSFLMSIGMSDIPSSLVFFMSIVMSGAVGYLLELGGSCSAGGSPSAGDSPSAEGSLPPPQAGSLAQAAFRLLLAQGALRADGLIFPSLTSQLFLIGHIALNKESLLRFKLLIQGGFTLDTCFEIPIDQRYLRTKGEESRSFAPGKTDRQTDNTETTGSSSFGLEIGQFTDRVLCQRIRSPLECASLDSSGGGKESTGSLTLRDLDWRAGLGWAVRLAALTLAPLSSSASAKARPMPWAAPVTSATLPFTCMSPPALGGQAQRLRAAAAFKDPARAHVWPGRARLPVGGDEAVKPRRHPGLCHLALSTRPVDLCLPDS